MTPEEEAEVLRQTEAALRDIVQSAVICGVAKLQMAMMLRAIASDLQPPILIEHVTVQ